MYRFDPSHFSAFRKRFSSRLRGTAGLRASASAQRVYLVLLACGLLFATPQARAIDPPAKPPAAPPDTLVLTDGEQLIGKLVKVLSGAVTFHSDVLGDVTVPLAKIKELHTAQAGQFAVVAKNQHLTRKSAAQGIPVGTIAIENNAIHVTPKQAPVQSIPAKNVAFLIDEPTYRREMTGHQDFFYGWTGSVTAGATLVESTNSAETYTGAVALVRAIPATSWLPPSSKTTFNMSGTYGLAKQPQIGSGASILQPASTTKTDILHGGAEYDRYWSTAFFGFASASADHNYGSGLQIQQSYGGGVGWSALRTPRNSLDVKAEMQYEQQQFYNGASSQFGTPTLNLASAAISETLKYNFPHALVLNQNVSLNPTFNVTQAYSAVANAGLIFPMYKRINFSFTSTDNYIGDPPQGYQRNSFQLTAGATYVIK